MIEKEDIIDDFHKPTNTGFKNKYTVTTVPLKIPKQFSTFGQDSKNFKFSKNFCKK